MGSLLFQTDDVSQIAFIFFLIMIGGHLIGCLFFLLASRTHSIYRHPSINPDVDCAEKPRETYSVGYGDWGSLYSYSFKTGVYLCLSIDMEGYSDLENLFIVLITPIGALFNALIFSNIIVLVSRRSALETQHVEHSDKIRQAMITLALPSSLQLRILSYYTYERIHRSHATFNALFQGLNRQLNFELHLVLYYDLLTNVPLFKNAEPRLLRELVLVLKDVLFLPGDYVCRFGDEGREMYFIYEGECSVIGENMTTVYRKLQPGDYFGEVSILTNQKRTAFVRADLFCTF